MIESRVGTVAGASIAPFPIPSHRTGRAVLRPSSSPTGFIREHASKAQHKHLFSPSEERGTLLSGGERQRLCLARAMLRRPYLLVLDAAGEHAISGAIVAANAASDDRHDRAPPRKPAPLPAHPVLRGRQVGVGRQQQPIPGAEFHKASRGKGVISAPMRRSMRSAF